MSGICMATCPFPPTVRHHREMETAPTVLISGAGVAGPALAFWLTRYGYRVVVVELATEIRPGGQTVDLRGAGADVVERMGLLEQMQGRALEQRGIAWVRSDGSRRAEMPVEAFDETGWSQAGDSARRPRRGVVLRDPRQCRLLIRHPGVGDDRRRRRSRRRAVGRHRDPGGPVGRRRRPAFGGAPPGVRTREQFVEPLRRVQRLVQCPRHDRPGRLVPDVPGAGRRNASLRPSHDPTTAKADWRSLRTAGYDRHDQDAPAPPVGRADGRGGLAHDDCCAAAARADFTRRVHAPGEDGSVVGRSGSRSWRRRVLRVTALGHGHKPGWWCLPAHPVVLGPTPATLSRRTSMRTLASSRRGCAFVERCRELPSSVSASPNPPAGSPWAPR